MQGKTEYPRTVKQQHKYNMCIMRISEKQERNRKKICKVVTICPKLMSDTKAQTRKRREHQPGKVPRKQKQNLNRLFIFKCEGKKSKIKKKTS